MKKLFVIAASCAAMTAIASADIQAPPGNSYTSSRKLGRALSNIIYGVTEIPEQILFRKTPAYGRKGGWTTGGVEGTSRALRRLGYGFYELFTFTCPTYRGTFKPPYEKCGSDNRMEMDVENGLSEFPPELGAESYYSHTRTNQY